MRRRERPRLDPYFHFHRRTMPMPDDKTPGATGRYPYGALRPDDEGELRARLTLTPDRLTLVKARFEEATANFERARRRVEAADDELNRAEDALLEAKRALEKAARDWPEGAR